MKKDIENKFKKIEEKLDQISIQISGINDTGVVPLNDVLQSIDRQLKKIAESQGKIEQTLSEHCPDHKNLHDKTASE